MNTARSGRSRNGSPPHLALLGFAAAFVVTPSFAHAQSIPYLYEVRIEAGPPCPGCPARACPDDSIDVDLRGEFPDYCRRLLDVSLIPNPAMTPLPAPPIVRVTYGNVQACLGCALTPQPWEARLRLPPLPSLGQTPYQLGVEARELDLCSPESTATDLGRIGVPFVVAEECSTVDACYGVGWKEGRPVGCAATFDLDTPAELVLRVGSTEPIAGVEGGLRLDTDMLRIDTVAAARADWSIQWTRTFDGSVRYLAFANTPGAAIPGQPDGRREPLLAVRVRVSELRGVVPEFAHIDAFELLVSDPLGRQILPCPEPAIDPPSTVGTLCRSGRCDVNEDGRKDVRDLVLMVGCLAPFGDMGAACGDSTRFDCDASGAFDIADVFCCGRAMLGGDGEGGPPPDSLRDAPNLVLRFDVPRDAGDGRIEVPLALLGLHEPAAAIVGARLDIAYPDDRYEVAGVKFEGLVTEWWTTHQVAAGRLRLAMLDLSRLPDRPLPPVVDLASSIRLSLRLRPGASAGGELSIAARDFAAADGVALATPNGDAHVALGGAGQVALTAPRPNPFGAGTSFALTVPVAGPVDVGVFDVVGRRVATLMNDTNAAAGVYALGWNGSDEARGRAALGVYFVKVVTGAGDASRKLLFLPGGTR